MKSFSFGQGNGNLNEDDKDNKRFYYRENSLLMTFRKCFLTDGALRKPKRIYF